MNIGVADICSNCWNLVALIGVFLSNYQTKNLTKISKDSFDNARRQLKQSAFFNK